MFKHSKFLNLLILALMVGSAFLFGRYTAKFPHHGQQKIFTKCNRSEGYKLINPLLDCSQDQADFSELKPFKQEVEDLIQKERANNAASFISVYYRDMNNGPWIGVNETENFAPASLLKLPVMVAYYKLSESQLGIMDDKIQVDSLSESGQTEQFIKPKERLEIGKTYTVRELIERMIRYSDNDSTELLIKHINIQSLANVYKDFSINLPSLGQPETQVDVKQYATFFRLLFNGSYLSPQDSEKAMETLASVDFKDGLVAGVPTGVVVAHKFGERVVDNQLSQIHDCGIVYYPKRPYLLCVMTRGQNEDQLIKVIKDISTLVYQQVDSQLADNK